MSSLPLDDRGSIGLARLAELEAVHVQATGSAPRRRWGTTQLNRSLFVALVAQFQSYCRRLHDEAVEVHVTTAVAGQDAMLPTLLTQGRKLDTQNPRLSALGADFGRLGFSFIDDWKAATHQTVVQLAALEDLLDFCNAVGQGDEVKIADLEAVGRIKSTKGSFQSYRKTVDQLAGTTDSAVSDKLAALLGIPRPW